MTKVIGYMEGTDSLWLTKLQLMGYSTQPISNGYDGHGHNIQLLNMHSNPGVILSWLHKLVPTPDVDITIMELLHRSTVYEVPVVAVCPREFHGPHCEKLAGEMPENVTLVDPADVITKIQQILG